MLNEYSIRTHCRSLGLKSIYRLKVNLYISEILLHRVEINKNNILSHPPDLLSLLEHLLTEMKYDSFVRRRNKCYKYSIILHHNLLHQYVSVVASFEYLF